jgi:hypothetical protein
MIFKELLQKGRTIFICGEDEDLRADTLDPLLASDIAHFYFITPKENLIRYLEEMSEPYLFSCVTDIRQIDLRDVNVIACGFKPVARHVIAALRQFKPAGLIFFDGKLGIFKPNWANIGSLEIIEQSLPQYVATHIKRKVYKSSQVVDREGTFFTDRGEMLDLYRDFIAHKGLRCCKIVGMKGIGKRAFIRRLKFVMALGENCFEVRFTDQTDDISYLLGQLLRMFGLAYDPHELEQFHHKRVLPVVERLFRAFDNLPQAKLIFYDMDAVYNAAKRQFYDRNIAAFFHQLLQRDTYRRHYNRVYCVANENFSFRDHDDRDATYTIHLKPMHPEHIRFIVEHEFNSRFNPQSAQAFMKYDFDTVHSLLGGHPQIAKLFVEACDTYPMASIINDAQFRKQFEVEKAAYLMRHIRLSDEEQHLLWYLALFSAHFQIDAIRALQARPHTLIENLRDKFLLEKVDFADGRSEYYVPSIIQDYARVQMPDQTAQTYHNRIGEYYWRKAEDLKTPPPEALQAYRLALYHFSAAGNSEQEKNLVAYFKGIFLKKAQDAYQRKEFETAWHYYHELAQQAELGGKDVQQYLECLARLQKPEAAAAFERAVQQYPHDRVVKTAYARYLADQHKYDHAERLCREVLNAFPNDKATKSLSRKIQKQKGATRMNPTVFISYSQKDLDFASKLKHALEDAAIGVTIDIESAKYGDNLDDFMRRAVREADFTVSVVSENSLKSVWVLEESLRTLMHEDVEEQKRFVPIYIDTKFLEPQFYFEIIDGVDQAIKELKELTIQAIDRNLGTAQFDKKRKRLVQLRNNLDTILERLQSHLVGDFSTPAKFADNLPRLVQVIQARVSSTAGQSAQPAPAAGSALTPGERDRLTRELKSLREQHELYSLKTDRLAKALAIETAAARIFQIEQQLKEPQAKRDELADRIRELEQRLG